MGGIANSTWQRLGRKLRVTCSVSGKVLSEFQGIEIEGLMRLSQIILEPANYQLHIIEN